MLGIEPSLATCEANASTLSCFSGSLAFVLHQGGPGRLGEGSLDAPAGSQLRSHPLLLRARGQLPEPSPALPAHAAVSVAPSVSLRPPSLPVPLSLHVTAPNTPRASLVPQTGSGLPGASAAHGQGCGNRVLRHHCTMKFRGWRVAAFTALSPVPSLSHSKYPLSE